MAVIVCILIDLIISLLPRGRFERWSWQIHVVALISQLPHLQYLTANVFRIAPAKRVEILHLSTPPVHATCPRRCSCVLSLWQDPGPGMTCSPVGLPSGPVDRCICPGCPSPMATCVMTVSVFERRSWQIHVVALISQCPHLQYLTANVSRITPAKRVENQGSPRSVSGNSSAPVHAIWPCVFLSVLSL